MTESKTKAKADKLNISYKPRFRDLVRGNFGFFYSVWSFKVLTLVSILYLFYVLQKVEVMLHVASWLRIFVIFFFPIFMLVYFPLALIFSARSSYKRLKGGVDYTITSSGIDVSEAGSRSQLDWSAMRRAVETRHDFLIISQTASFHLIPKLALATGDEIKQLRSLLREGLGKKAK